MPLYEFECIKCGHKFEQIKTVEGRNLSTCPECGDYAKRVVSAHANMAGNWEG